MQSLKERSGVSVNEWDWGKMLKDAFSYKKAKALEVWLSTDTDTTVS